MWTLQIASLLVVATGLTVNTDVVLTIPGTLTLAEFQGTNKAKYTKVLQDAIAATVGNSVKAADIAIVETTTTTAKKGVTTAKGATTAKAGATTAKATTAKAGATTAKATTAKATTAKATTAKATTAKATTKKAAAMETVKLGLTLTSGATEAELATAKSVTAIKSAMALSLAGVNAADVTITMIGSTKIGAAGRRLAAVEVLADIKVDKATATNVKAAVAKPAFKTDMVKNVKAEVKKTDTALAAKLASMTVVAVVKAAPVTTKAGVGAKKNNTTAAPSDGAFHVSVWPLIGVLLAALSGSYLN